MKSDKPFIESQENKDALTRLVRDRWDNIVKACKKLGLPVGKKPAAPKPTVRVFYDEITVKTRCPYCDLFLLPNSTCPNAIDGNWKCRKDVG